MCGKYVTIEIVLIAFSKKKAVFLFSIVKNCMWVIVSVLLFVIFFIIFQISFIGLRSNIVATLNWLGNNWWCIQWFIKRKSQHEKANLTLESNSTVRVVAAMQPNFNPKKAVAWLGSASGRSSRAGQRREVLPLSSLSSATVRNNTKAFPSKWQTVFLWGVCQS